MKKKIVAMMLASVMACGLWACGGSGEKSEDSAKQEEVKKEKKAEEAKKAEEQKKLKKQRK